MVPRPLHWGCGLVALHDPPEGPTGAPSTSLGVPPAPQVGVPGGGLGLLRKGCVHVRHGEAVGGCAALPHIVGQG